MFNTWGLVLTGLLLTASAEPLPFRAHRAHHARADAPSGRDRASINDGWRFSRFTSNPDSLSYDTLKPWILPSSNDFVSGDKYVRPSGTPPGSDVQYVQASFDDSAWQSVNVPHDWAIAGPFGAPGISPGMGKLPSNGVGWYRRTISLSSSDVGKSVFLEVDGAMSYAAIWLNGVLVGGWPYGYASFRLDLTPYIQAGDNTLAIRLDNALDSSRWYPGAGLYRDLWLVKVDPTHVGYQGTYITTPTVSSGSATVNVTVDIENKSNATQQVDVLTEIRILGGSDIVATVQSTSATVSAGTKQAVQGTTTISQPLLWGPLPNQKPNLYVATTTLSANTTVIDTYETRFGVRTLDYDANQGFLINGERVYVKGTCNHHDQGSLGAAFHPRAAERQLQMLQDMGNNALRTSHNPPAPGLLDLADSMGLLVLDELFDCWAEGKTTNDYHLLWSDWHEADTRSFIRRDRNHPSIIAWSFGNEIPEQNDATGGPIATELRDIMHAEDPTRQTTSAMNSAAPGNPFADAVDIIGLNYQGEGQGNSNTSSFPGFHSKYPNKMIWTTESSSALSTRGTFIFPVTKEYSAVVGADSGENATAMYVSAYDLYAPSWAASPDKVFYQQDMHPYVAGEFVWTGWDYIGEPTPYDGARSSYFGIIDLAGFKKDRFYLYQARWRADLPMAHLVPHWTWPERVGQVTPVHVYSSADEAELFVNGKSAGRQKKADYTYRFRWSDVVYQPGDLKVVTYKNGVEWATDTRKTIGDAANLTISADRTTIKGDGRDLSFVSVSVVDSNGDVVPRANNAISFSISGPAQIVSTDNGDPTDTTAFPSLTRNAFNGLALAIVRTNSSASGEITVTATASGLGSAQVKLQAA